MTEPLKEGDIVTHKSEPDICGVICGKTDAGYIIDYSIALPPAEAPAEDLIIIKQFSAAIKKSKAPPAGSTDGYIRSLHKI